MRAWASCLLLAALAPGLGGCGESDEGYVDQLRKTYKKAKDLASIEPARSCVKSFHALKGRYPKDLDELKKEFKEFPPPPEGMKYKYDPKTGALDLVKTE